MLGTGSNVELGCAKTVCDPVASLRSLARRYPFCTNVSCPSGVTSLIVACRSTSGVEDFTQRYSAPAPTTAVSDASGGERYDAAVPAGFCFHCQSHCDALPHSPPVPVL